MDEEEAIPGEPAYSRYVLPSVQRPLLCAVSLVFPPTSVLAGSHRLYLFVAQEGTQLAGPIHKLWTRRA
jgi:hypothetical protein